MDRKILIIGLSVLQTLSAAPLPTPFRVTLLGTIGGPRGDPDRYGASLLVEAGGETFLFDCGRGVSLRLVQAGRAAVDIDKVFLTHMHADHIMGLPDVWLTSSGVTGRAPLRVWGPEGTAGMAAGLERSNETEFRLRIRNSGSWRCSCSIPGYG